MSRKRRTDEEQRRSDLPPAERPARMDLVFQSCLVAYGYVRREGRLADRALDFTLRRAKTLYSHERRMVAESVYGLLRRQRMVDWLLERGRPGFEKVAASAQDLARLIVSRSLEEPNLRWLNALSMATASDRALVERVPELLRELGKLPEAQRFGIELSVPDFLAARLLAELGPRAHAVMSAMNQRAPLTARTNTLKGTRDELVNLLQSEDLRVRPTRRSPLGVLLDTRVNAFGLQAFRDGRFEIQDEGSQLLGMLVDPMPTKAVDACAGAGGKTLQLAAEMKNRGELYAMDVDAPRLEELKDRARRAGVHNVRVSLLPADDQGADAAVQALEKKADRVFVDAPCSGTGTFRRKPDARYRLTPESLDEHAERQARLLARFSRMVKPGGRLIYGTCSVLQSENEQVVDAFLERHPEFSVLSAKGRVPDDTLSDRGFLRLWPDVHDTDGFFGAILVRSKAP